MPDKSITYHLHGSNGFQRHTAMVPETVSNTAVQKNEFVASEYDREQWWQPLAGYGFFDSYTNVDKYRSYAYAAISKRGLNIAKANIYIYRETKSKKTELKDHVLMKVFRGSNIYGESIEMTLFFTSVHLDLYGEAFWHVVTVNSVFGKVVTEIRLLMGKTEPVMNKDNTLIESYRNGTINFSKDEIIHFKNPNPANRNKGFIPVNAFNFTLDIEFLQSRTVRTMFKNNANLEGVITLPTSASPSVQNSLQAQWQSKYEGSQNAGKTPVLSGGAQYTRIQASPREMDYKDSRLTIRDEIFVILDVPKTVMNVSDDVNYNNSKSALRSWLENSISPYCKVVIESQINAYFRKIYGERFLLSMEYEFETDRELQLKTLELYLSHRLIKKEVIAEQEGYSASDVPEDKTILEPNPKKDEPIEAE